MSVLLRQPHGFEGFGSVAEVAATRDESVANVTNCTTSITIDAALPSAPAWLGTSTMT